MFHAFFPSRLETRNPLRKRPSRSSVDKVRWSSRRLRAEPLEGRWLLSAGQLDPSFGVDGILFPDLGDAGANSADKINKMVIDSNDRLVIMGYSAHYGGLVLARLLEDGNWDTNFGEAGIHAISEDFGSDSRYGSVAVDDHERIVVSVRNTERTTIVARYQENGRLDTSFGTDGTVAIADVEGTVRAVDSNGRILVAGRELWDGPWFEYRAAVGRLTSGGVLDTSFDNDGVRMINLGADGQTVNGLAVDGSGRIIVVGYTTASESEMWVARLTPDGALDTSFADGGVFDLPGESANGVAIDDTGRIVFSATLPDHDAVVIRLTPDGVLDTTFSGDGMQVVAEKSSAGRLYLTRLTIERR